MKRFLSTLFLVLLLPSVAFADWSTGIGFNFRDTESCSGNAADGPSQQWVGDTHNYDQGYTIDSVSVSAGYSSGVNVQGRDYCTGSSIPELLGYHRHNEYSTTQTTFRVDLPATGSYDICAAFGYFYNGSTWPLHITFRDDATTILQILDADGPGASNEWYDATGTQHNSDTDWLANQSCITHTFTSTVLYVDIGNATTVLFQPIAHMTVTQNPVATPTPTPTATPTSTPTPTPTATPGGSIGAISTQLLD